MRLVRKRDFARVFREGSRARGAIVLVVVAPNGLPHARLGLSVGRSIWKGAVERNRVRRIFREAFRLSYADLPQGVDIVMIPAAPRLDPKLAGTRSELVSLARRALRRYDEARARADAPGTRADAPISHSRADARAAREIGPPAGGERA